ncbi:MAG: hypothetical protein ABSG05_02710 [Candidatus Pacearchaeota archaeon]|jgi:hypothetical protein
MAKKTFSKMKKGVKAKSIKKKLNPGAKSTEVVYHSTKEIKVEKALIDNFIGLQKVMVGLSTKFDSLSDQISKLLDLFEISAKSLARKELSSPGTINTQANQADARRILDRLDNISKQAGLIGRGLALIHEVGTENANPVIPLNINKNRLNLGTMPAISKPFPTMPKTDQSVPAPSDSGSDQTNSAPAKKMTMELDSFEKSSSRDSNNVP